MTAATGTAVRHRAVLAQLLTRGDVCHVHAGSGEAERCGVLLGGAPRAGPPRCGPARGLTAWRLSRSPPSTGRAVMPRVPAAGTPRPRLPDGPPGGPHRHVGPYWLWHRQAAPRRRLPRRAGAALGAGQVRGPRAQYRWPRRRQASHRDRSSAASAMRRGSAPRPGRPADKPPYPNGPPPGPATEYTSTGAEVPGHGEPRAAGSPDLHQGLGRHRAGDSGPSIGTVSTSSARTPTMPGRRRTRDRHRGQALVEDGGRDQRRAPADRGDGRRAGGGRESGNCPPATAGVHVRIVIC